MTLTLSNPQVSEVDVAALKALAREVAEAQSALAALQKSAAGLRGREAALEKAIEDAGGAPMKRQRALVDRLKEARLCLSVMQHGSHHFC